MGDLICSGCGSIFKEGDRVYSGIHCEDCDRRKNMDIKIPKEEADRKRWQFEIEEINRKDNILRLLFEIEWKVAKFIDAIHGVENQKDAWLEKKDFSRDYIEPFFRELHIDKPYFVGRD